MTINSNSEFMERISLGTDADAKSILKAYKL